jgi:dTDP-4-dehydrorhamnose reductase
MVSSLKNSNNIELVNDIWFSPVPIRFLIRALAISVVEKFETTANIGSWGGTTKFEFGNKLGMSLGLNVSKIRSVTAEECLAYSTYRPKNMVMDNSLWEKTAGMKCPTTDEVIDSLVDEYM